MSGRAVLGAALNFKGTLAALGDAVTRDPYKEPPNAPVLYIKPENTWSRPGDAIPCPAGVDELKMGGTLGVVIGGAVCRVREADALGYVRGYMVVNEISIPHASYFRPAIRERCRDGFCCMGDENGGVANPDALAIRISINGEVRAKNTTRNLVRSVARLIADVSEFMTLGEGDVLLVGEPENAPLARPGDRVRVEIDGLGFVENRISREEAPPSRSVAVTAGAGRRGRVAFAGAVHEATPAPKARVRLANGRTLDEDQVVWLPPIEARTIFAVGLNYANHARELSFKPPAEPLVFLKTRHTLVGHRGLTSRPKAADYMHYECELAVVIGKTARAISRHDALDYVRGYTVANDYAIRDYLENYYRPNLRVKNRDCSTPLGPWLVERAAVPDPSKLKIRTWVNGKLTQEGSTRDMIFSVPALIEYLSAFMTLSPGDMILTGTPEGLASVKAGDEVVTEIKGVGRLVNTIVA
jgi:4-hydroxyphenylacetate degradation bifunctional isomerase/decarboxylase decarboxylase subunit/4-hydroxyphenylacetate degradation bifunctional isomerase/decarboxylase isomerase subunit